MSYARQGSCVNCVQIEERFHIHINTYLYTVSDIYFKSILPFVTYIGDTTKTQHIVPQPSISWLLFHFDNKENNRMPYMYIYIYTYMSQMLQIALLFNYCNKSKCCYIHIQSISCCYNSFHNEYNIRLSSYANDQPVNHYRSTAVM